MVCGCSQQPEPVDNAQRALSLEELCTEHATDKCGFHHNYVPLYDTFFEPRREATERVLEIGVLEGGSMRMWQAYFPNAQIYGLNINDSSSHDTNRITTFVADQSSREQLGGFLEAHGSDFDIVIDDGGHSMEQQQTSFGFLFPHVRQGGVYIIEDIHTSFPDLYPGYGVSSDGTNATFAMIERWIRTGEFQSEYLSDEELDYLTQNVDHCLYSYRTTEFHSDFFLCQKKLGWKPSLSRVSGAGCSVWWQRQSVLSSSRTGSRNCGGWCRRTDPRASVSGWLATDRS